jgi:hypothetical protein
MWFGTRYRGNIFPEWNQDRLYDLLLELEWIDFDWKKNDYPENNMGSWVFRTLNAHKK